MLDRDTKHRLIDFNLDSKNNSQLEFKTLNTSSVCEFKIKGSRFIGFAFEVQNEAHFQLELEKIKKEHFKSRHHCFGYRLEPGGIERANDDGEPSGTAGLPILNQLKAYNLHHAAIVVVRYFGGTKLGTSGLIQAYKATSKEAIEANEIYLFVPRSKFKVSFDYKNMGKLLNTVKKLNFTILSKQLDNSPHIVLSLINSEKEKSIIALQSALFDCSEEQILEDKVDMSDYGFDVLT